jgi:hypothetical protein
MTVMRVGLAVLTLGWLLCAGCTEEPPPRDYIPELKARLFRLQEAVKAQNRAAIDSLLSVQILDNQQDSDSLLSFTYGPEGSFDFRQFGLAEYTYTHDKARIDCFIMDSTQSRNRPLILTYVREHDLWLLKRFEAGEVEQESSIM